MLPATTEDGLALVTTTTSIPGADDEATTTDAPTTTTTTATATATATDDTTSNPAAASTHATTARACKQHPNRVIYGSADGPAGSGAAGGWSAERCSEACRQHTGCGAAVHIPAAIAALGVNGGYCEFWGVDHGVLTGTAVLPGVDLYACGPIVYANTPAR